MAKGGSGKPITVTSDEELQRVNPSSKNPVLIEEIAEDEADDEDENYDDENENDEVFEDCLPPATENKNTNPSTKATVISQPNSSLDPLADTYRVIYIEKHNFQFRN